MGVNAVAALCERRNQFIAGEIGGHRSPLQSDRRAYEFASAQSKAPRVMRGARNPDTRIGHHIEIFGRALLEPMARIVAQIRFMIASSNPQCLGKFAGARADSVNIVDAAPLFHERDSAPWFKRTDQNETICFPFDEHIQHPMHTIVEIDIRRAGLVTLDERSRARSRKSVRRFIVKRRVSFNLDDNSCAFSPDKLRAHQLASTTERITPKKCPANHSSSHEIGDGRRNADIQTVTMLKTCRLVKDR
jgi:hypothetical protein